MRHLVFYSEGGSLPPEKIWERDNVWVGFSALPSCCEVDLRDAVSRSGYGAQEKVMSIQVAEKEKLSTSIAGNMMMWMQYHVWIEVEFYYQPNYLIF